MRRDTKVSLDTLTLLNAPSPLVSMNAREGRRVVVAESPAAMEVFTFDSPLRPTPRMEGIVESAGDSVRGKPPMAHHEDQRAPQDPGTAEEAAVRAAKNARARVRALQRDKEAGQEESRQKYRLWLGKGWLWDAWLAAKRWVFRARGVPLWREKLAELERRCGSSVAVSFSFLRWVLLLNVALTALWAFLVVFPFLDDPPPEFTWGIFSEAGPWKVLQGKGLENTFWFYGGYPARGGGGAAAGEPPAGYRMGVAYTAAIAATYALSLVGLLATVGRRAAGAGDARLVRVDAQYPFSALTFAAWDFNISSEAAAERRRLLLNNEIMERLGDSLVVPERGLGLALLRLRRFFALCVLWPALIAGTAAAIFHTVRNRQALNDKLGGFGYADAVLVMLVNLAGQTAVRALVALERWPPARAAHVESIKLFVLRLMSLATLVYKLYEIVKSTEEASASTGEGVLATLEACEGPTSCEEGFACCDAACAAWEGVPALEGLCAPTCEEDAIGVIFMRMLLTNTMFQPATEAAVHRAAHRRGHTQTVHLSVLVIDVLGAQALVWIGSAACPMLPLLAVLGNAAMFHAKRYQVLHVSKLEEIPYTANRASIVSYMLLLLTLLLCSIPTSVSLFLPRDRPHAGGSMAGVVAEWVRSGPALIHTVALWAFNPLVLWMAIGGLVMWLVVAQGHLVRQTREGGRLQRELAEHRREAQEKVALLRRAAGGALRSPGPSPRPSGAPAAGGGGGAGGREGGDQGVGGGGGAEDAESLDASPVRPRPPSPGTVTRKLFFSPEAEADSRRRPLGEVTNVVPVDGSGGGGRAGGLGPPQRVLLPLPPRPFVPAGSAPRPRMDYALPPPPQSKIRGAARTRPRPGEGEAATPTPPPAVSPAPATEGVEPGVEAVAAEAVAARARERPPGAGAGADRYARPARGGGGARRGASWGGAADRPAPTPPRPSDIASRAGSRGAGVAAVQLLRTADSPARNTRGAARPRPAEAEAEAEAAAAASTPARGGGEGLPPAGGILGRPQTRSQTRAAASSGRYGASPASVLRRPPPAGGRGDGSPEQGGKRRRVTSATERIMDMAVQVLE